LKKAKKEKQPNIRKSQSWILLDTPLAVGAAAVEKAVDGNYYRYSTGNSSSGLCMVSVCCLKRVGDWKRSGMYHCFDDFVLIIVSFAPSSNKEATRGKGNMIVMRMLLLEEPPHILFRSYPALSINISVNDKSNHIPCYLRRVKEHVPDPNKW
jgi:hypothetical protein